MKIDELFVKIQESEELQKQLKTALDSGQKSEIESFIKANGCDATLEEAKNYLEQVGKEALEKGELTTEEMEMVSGGSFVVTTIALALIGASVGFLATSGGKLAQKSCS